MRGSLASRPAKGMRQVRHTRRTHSATDEIGRQPRRLSRWLSSSASSPSSTSMLCHHFRCRVRALLVGIASTTEHHIIIFLKLGLVGDSKTLNGNVNIRTATFSIFVFIIKWSNEQIALAIRFSVSNYGLRQVFESTTTRKRRFRD